MRPAIPLLPYQRKWLADASRFKIALKCRQSGYSFVQSLECVLDCMQRVTTWVVLSRGERQSAEFARHATIHSKALGHAVAAVEVKFEWRGLKLAELRIDFPNGSRIIALPANADTARGYAGNVVLDEFAFHAEAREIWRALYPIISRGYQLRIISTPNGRRGKFYELWTRGKRWSKHEIDIYEAVRQGLPQNPEELKAALDDDDGWLQEYCCVFLDEASAWIPLDWIDACEDDTSLVVPAVEIASGTQDAWRPYLAGEDLTRPETWAPLFAGLARLAGDRLFLGLDIGRQKDLSALVVDEHDLLLHRMRALVRLAGQRFAVQRAVVEAALPYVRRACIDATGIGAQLAEELAAKFGAKVEPVTFTLAAKENMAVLMRRAYEDRAVRIPSDAALRRAIHAVKRLTTATGNARFDAERTEAGHADEFWAQALALAAGACPSGPIEAETFDLRRSAELDRGAWGF